MRNTILIGIDSGFASIGYAALAFPPRLDATAVRCDAFGVFETRKSPKKLHLLATEDNLRRARDIAEFYDALFTRLQSDDRNVVAGACLEAMSWPRNAGATAKMGIAYGVLAAVAARHRIPLLQASPQAIKKKLCGRRDASKLDIEAVVRSRVTHMSVDGARDFSSFADQIPKSKREHCFDAAAAVFACCDAEPIQFMRRSAA